LCAIPRWGFFGVISSIQLWIIGLIFAIWPEQNMTNGVDRANRNQTTSNLI